MSITEWGSEKGQEVLKKLSKLYLNLVWESTVLLAICSGEFQPGPGQFGRADLDRLIPPEAKVRTFNLSFSCKNSKKFAILILYHY